MKRGEIMEFIKLGQNRYLVKDSNNLIVEEKDIIEFNKEKSSKDKKVCKACEIKVDKKGELIDNEKSVKLDDNK